MFNDLGNAKKWTLVTLAGIIGTFVAAQRGYAQGTWTTVAPVPSPTEGMTVEGAGQVIVAAYGFSSASGGNTNQTRLYNISGDSWTAGAPAPLPARADAAYGETIHGGFLYVIGGGNSGVALSDLERYDPVLDAWTTLTQMPTARTGAVAAVVDDGDQLTVRIFDRINSATSCAKASVILKSFCREGLATRK